MFLTLLGAVAPLAMRIIGMYLDKSQADAETKKRFLQFVESASSAQTGSAQLKASAEAQLQRLKDQENAPKN